MNGFVGIATSYQVVSGDRGPYRTRPYPNRVGPGCRPRDLSSGIKGRFTRSYAISGERYLVRRLRRICRGRRPDNAALCPIDWKVIGPVCAPDTPLPVQEKSARQVSNVRWADSTHHTRPRAPRLQTPIQPSGESISKAIDPYRAFGSTPLVPSPCINVFTEP